MNRAEVRYNSTMGGDDEAIAELAERYHCAQKNVPAVIRLGAAIAAYGKYVKSQQANKPFNFRQFI